MSTLKLLQEQPVNETTEFKISRQDNFAAEFPLTRYFQIHFQHIHENTRGVQEELNQLRQYVADLNVKLDRLATLLIDQQTTKQLEDAYSSSQRNKNSGH